MRAGLEVASNQRWPEHGEFELEAEGGAILETRVVGREPGRTRAWQRDALTFRTIEIDAFFRADEATATLVLRSTRREIWMRKIVMVEVAPAGGRARALTPEV